MFNDAVTVITGGSSGLGKALGKRLVEKGAVLALIARDRSKLEKARDEMTGHSTGNPRVEIFPCDVSDDADVDKAFKAIADTLGMPDILINSAGILREGHFEKVPLSTFREVMDIDFFGVLNCTRAVLPYFRQKGRGRIVNISSLGGRIASFGYSAYCSSKFALVGLTDTLRVELKPQNIKVHLVCPGEFESPMVDELNTYRTIENRVLTQTVPVLPLDVVADEVVRGIQKGRYLIIPGFITRFLEMSSRWFPSISRLVVDFQIRRVYQGPQGS